ncbi:rhomboid family intramembrane serine protease [Flavobacteriaceae bacterium Ap0902]|nr:rhomboid family intramembrane serine protease [Flavobacteriaceae bacterium Ap0902]
MAIIDDIRNRFNKGDLSIKLIYINVVVFLIATIVQLIAKNGFLTQVLGLPSNLPSFITKPWTLFTYMFLHVRAMHLLFNMLMLWVVGQFFFRYFGDKAFAQFYFLGGLCGGVFYVLFQFIYPQSSLLMGASAAIYSVLFAMVAYKQDLKVKLMFIQEPVKLMYVAIGFIVLGFIFNAENIGGNISHVGGAVFGYLYMKQFERGQTLSGFFNSIFGGLKPKKKSNLHVKKNAKPPRDDYEYAEWKKQREARTNQILEKISRSGYNSLTDEEKAFLFQQKGGEK